MRSKNFTYVKAIIYYGFSKNKLKKFHRLKIIHKFKIFIFLIILYIYDYGHAIFP